MEDPRQEHERKRLSHRTWVWRSTGGMSLAALLLLGLYLDLASAGAVTVERCAPSRGSGDAMTAEGAPGRMRDSSQLPPPSMAAGAPDATSCSS
jgi:hypothetical protein